MKTVAFVPIKLHNQRLPGKNLLPLGGKPLCRHLFDTLSKVKGTERVYAYCSDESLRQYLPKTVELLKRSKELDADEVRGLQIYNSFVNEVQADVYVLAHATSPFIERESIQRGLDAVLSGEYDSAFSAQRVQTFAWYEGKPINYSLEEVPRTQDIEPVWVETSAFYIFRREILVDYGRRIGFSPYMVEVEGLETVDIDEPVDYEMAKRMIGDIDD